MKLFLLSSLAIVAASAAAPGCGPRAAPAQEVAAAPADQRVLDVIASLERRPGIGVSREDGGLLRRLVEQNRVRRAVEIGTYRGYSGLWLALGLRKTGGSLTTYDIDPRIAEEAGRNFAQAGVQDIVTQVVGDAHQEIGKLKPPIDLAFIDADKDGYLDYLQKLLPLMAPGGLIVAHNVRFPSPDPEFMRAIRTDPRLETSFANMDGAGMSISRKRP